MATDPYVWAREFANSQYQRANNADDSRDRLLLSVFNEEAARQRPYIAAPLEQAIAEKNAARQRRYQLMRDADKAKAAKDAGVGGGAGSTMKDENGNEGFMLNGKFYTTRTADEVAAEDGAT